MAFRFNQSDSAQTEAVEHDIVIEIIDGVPVEITAEEGEERPSSGRAEGVHTVCAARNPFASEAQGKGRKR